MNMGMNLHLTQRLSMQCTVCGGDLDDDGTHANDENLQAVSCLTREASFRAEPLASCPKCGRMVLASKLPRRKPSRRFWQIKTGNRWSRVTKSVFDGMRGCSRRVLNEKGEVIWEEIPEKVSD